MFSFNLGLGGLADALFGDDEPSWQERADWQWDKQKKLAKNAVRWRVQDAREAGIHPLAALGGSSVGQVAAPAPSFRGGNDALAGSSVSGSLADLGSAFATERAKLSNEKLRADIERNKAITEWYRARSRTLAAGATAAARGGTIGAQGAPQPVRAFGATVVRDPKAFSSSDVIQREFGDWVEGPIGASSFIYSALPENIGARDWVYDQVKDTDPVGYLVNNLWGD